MNGSRLLLFTVISSSSVALILKAAGARRIPIWGLIASNYFVCSLSNLLWGGWQTIAGASPLLWGLSVFIGSMYVLSLWLFHKAISADGLALSTTLMRLSSALPTLGSLLIFREGSSPLQAAGIALAFLSLPLAGKEPLHIQKSGQRLSSGITWGLLLFGAYGVTDFTFKIQAELIPGTHPQAFMTGIFGTALLITLPGLFRKPQPSTTTLLWGALLGAANMLATYFWIRTLAVLPGAIAYPTLGVGVITLSTLAGLVIWKEKLRPANALFLILASLAILLINI